MECRSEERRQYIVDNYNVVPVAHIQLLNGQTKHSDAGQTIENDYYIFKYNHIATIIFMFNYTRNYNRR